MPRRRVDVEKGLLKKGFRRREGDHHYYNYFNTQGKKTAVFTKTSHSHTEISASVISLMAKQCKLSRQTFDMLVDCPLSQQEYETLLILGGHVSPVTPGE
ncbi:hypothetical protein CR152_11670 [Massilia violaceinigra]|uniref:Addiction module toxin, HicA family n=1 Tax=Massilia violaceinigra TaxID=2045208 RepID=A0A2D2DJF4_9BURK|nr:hypothetical protein CR152_11670 [Massilia violaceinigra]